MARCLGMGRQPCLRAVRSVAAAVLLAVALAVLPTRVRASECKRLFPLEEIGMSVRADTMTSPWQLAFLDIRTADEADDAPPAVAAKHFSACNCTLELTALVRLWLRRAPCRAPLSVLRIYGEKPGVRVRLLFTHT
jgi:hypothetical protein